MLGNRRNITLKTDDLPTAPWSREIFRGSQWGKGLQQLYQPWFHGIDHSLVYLLRQSGAVPLVLITYLYDTRSRLSSEKHIVLRTQHIPQRCAQRIVRQQFGCSRSQRCQDIIAPVSEREGPLVIYLPDHFEQRLVHCPALQSPLAEHPEQDDGYVLGCRLKEIQGIVHRLGIMLQGHLADYTGHSMSKCIRISGTGPVKHTLYPLTVLSGILMQ